MGAIMDINNKLSQIQGELHVPKTQRNNFGGYNYRSCEDILETVKPLLKYFKLTLTVSDETVPILDNLIIIATATLSDGTKEVKTTAQAAVDLTKKGMDSAQCFGSSSSYARKYALNGLFCIDDTKDPDHTNKHDRIERKSTVVKKATPNIGGFTSVGKAIENLNINQSGMASDSQKKCIFAIVKQLGWEDDYAKEQMVKVCQKSSTSDLTKSDASEVISHFKSIQEAK